MRSGCPASLKHSRIEYGTVELNGVHVFYFAYLLASLHTGAWSNYLLGLYHSIRSMCLVHYLKCISTNLYDMQMSLHLNTSSIALLTGNPVSLSSDSQYELWPSVLIAYFLSSFDKSE